MNDKSRITPWEADERFQHYVRHFRESTIKDMADSAFVTTIVPDDDNLENFDVKFATEIGASLLLDKPIVLLAVAGRDIPPRLRRIADLVIEGDLDTDEGRAHVQAELKGFMNKLEAREEV